MASIRRIPSKIKYRYSICIKKDHDISLYSFGTLYDQCLIHSAMGRVRRLGSSFVTFISSHAPNNSLYYSRLLPCL